jgi:hypothetical protein
MQAECRQCAKGWVRFLYNHNPFYVVSAVLVLYGLHVSFADSLEPTEGWLFTQLFMGYMLLVAAAAVLVVRLGRVWEDARTLVLLVAMLMIALASSFDRVSLDDEIQGARFLACGLAFSLLLSETLLRMLRLRFPWAYRGPFYLLLALVFAYPAWLGHLSLEDRTAQMSWYVLGFPSFAAIVSAALAPAARRRGRDVNDNGTPWGWPLYPWSLFVLLAAAILLRSYALSLAFDPTKGLASGFQLYFLVPLLLSWLLLWVEGADHSKPGRKTIAVAAPLALVPLALPGPAVSLAEDRYLQLLTSALGSPIQIAACLLVAYFVYIWLRGIREAEFGLLLTLGGLAFVDAQTVNLDTLSQPHPAPLVAAIGLLAIGSAWYGSALRMALAIIAAMVGLSFALQETGFVAARGYLPIHVTFLAVMALGLTFHDWLGRRIAEAAAVILTSTSLLILVAHRFLFPEIPAVANAAVALALAATSAAYWIKNRRFADLKAGVTCLAIALVLVGEHFIAGWLAYLLLRGRRWIGWGVVFFLVGFVVSLMKGGQLRRIRRRLIRFHFMMRSRFGRT